MPGGEARKIYLYAAREANVLTLTSRCNVRCIFCSHRQNPPGVETYFLPPLPLEEAASQAALLSPRRKVVLGESATRICEGEPFTHPRLKEILSLVRSRLPGTPLQITTNGLLLESEVGPFLETLKPLEFILSLNSTDPALRTKIMGKEASRVPPALRVFARHDLPFHGSLVALPGVTGFDDIRRTIRHLREAGALSLRVFLPGYTRLAPRELRFDPSLVRELAEFCDEEARNPVMPLTLEPPLVKDLTPVVAGVMPGSPAFRAGIRRGDIILQVDGRVPFSRAAAFKDVLERQNPSLNLSRHGEDFSLNLQKGKEEASGLVMDYDLEERALNLIRRAAGSGDPEDTLILTSRYAYPLLRWVFAREGLPYRLKLAKNRFFGGSIGCSGLLTVRDFLQAAMEEKASRKFSLVLLPGEAFDSAGRDLTRASYLDLEEALEVPVVPLK